MDTDVLLVRDGPGYRVVFGHLRLAVILSEADEVRIIVKGEGEGVIRKASDGLWVSTKNHCLPLLVR